MDNVNWADAIQPLLKKYKGKQHPLDYKNIYQLVVMVVLSAQDSDRHINQIAPLFFEQFPHTEVLATASPEYILSYISKVRNAANKAKWLSAFAQSIKKDSNIPLSLDALVALPGIGRKSANVILREAGASPEGIIVDLHVVRVAPRLGMATGTNPLKIELQMMKLLSKKDWDIGMAISFLGREICRPTPKCELCLMNAYCHYYLNNTNAAQ